MFSGLRHTRDQFSSRMRQLRQEWAFCNKLRSGSGLGRLADGTVHAIDDWREKETQKNPALKKFRTALPIYLGALDEMDQMFDSMAVDGSTAFVAGQDDATDIDSSNEEAADEQADMLTPLSVGHKRASSTSTTASSPSKRSKSPAVHHYESGIREHNKINRQRLAAFENAVESRSQDYMTVHTSLSSKAPVQPAAASRVEDPWDEDFEDLLFELMEDDDAAFLHGTYQYAVHIDKHLCRVEFRQPLISGLEWVQRKLGDAKSCYTMFRMSPAMFLRLHDVLVQSYGLKCTAKSTSIEALGIFLWMVGQPQGVRSAEDRFERSLATVSSMFDKVLKCVVRLATDIIKPVDPQFRTMHPRLRNRRFYPFFKDCIGAIDGTHIPCVVPTDKFVQHLCRKSMTTQNVMAICDFDMRFTFVLACWPGSVHDMRPFNDALQHTAMCFLIHQQGNIT